ncbi:MAG: type II toxin-antitoxin system MqsA family antitoxin [bacterium]|nr:type II toxin-antitoxin system MqsA family antitoxin [bacterium]
MECLYCKGKMDKGKTTYSINRRSYHLFIEDVPAFVCKQCGEPYFGEEEVDAIQDLIQDMDKKTSAIQTMELAA